MGGYYPGGIWAGYFGTHLWAWPSTASDRRPPDCLLGLATALGGVGFLDDIIKIRRSRKPRAQQNRQVPRQITRRTVVRGAGP